MFFLSSLECCPVFLPTETSLRPLEIFERRPLPITFDMSFEQKNGPAFAPHGSTLEIEVVGDGTKHIDL